MSNRVKDEDLVAVRMSRSAGMVVAMMGILRARAAYMPIDITFPRGEHLAVPRKGSRKV